MIAIVIPAYQPDARLVTLVRQLRTQSNLPVVIVNDGSARHCDAVFDAVAGVDCVFVLRHAVNLGKGAALKTGFNYCLCAWPELRGVVTADADGQHLPHDILRVARALDERTDTLILGARDFFHQHAGAPIPLRSRIGNTFTVGVMRVVTGHKLSDTQTGLRGIPASLLPHMLRVLANGFEFELDMLLAAKAHNTPLAEVPIETVYLEQNRSSHFNPLTDSLKIYFTLLRFGLVSAATTIIDNAVFFACAYSGAALWQAQVASRVVALLFNYRMARKAVFLSDENTFATFGRYLALVATSGAVSYTLLNVLHSRVGVPLMPAKIAAELLLFFINFTLQRDFIFTKRKIGANATDWDAYYAAPAPTAQVTRRYTARTIVECVRRFAGTQRPTIVEIGGANSCFVETVLERVAPARYHIVDNNAYGLSLLADRDLARRGVSWSIGNVLDLHGDASADLAYSIGLVEHFDVAQTAEAVAAHFRLVRPGGHVLISFPTPTWLYRVARGVIEMLGLWKFPDERPLKRDEVARVMAEHGDIVWEKTLWPLVLTQHMIVARKR